MSSASSPTGRPTREIQGLGGTNRRLSSSTAKLKYSSPRAAPKPLQREGRRGRNLDKDLIRQYDAEYHSAPAKSVGSKSSAAAAAAQPSTALSACPKARRVRSNSPVYSKTNAGAVSKFEDRLVFLMSKLHCYTSLTPPQQCNLYTMHVQMGQEVFCFSTQVSTCKRTYLKTYRELCAPVEIVASVDRGPGVTDAFALYHGSIRSL